MPDYKFTGAFPRVMTGLVQGVNALSTNNDVPYGSTVVCEPGDTLHTDDPYPHAELIDGAPPIPSTPLDEIPAPPPEPPEDTNPEGTPPADPAPTTESEPTA